jgi:hypothetical protein
MDDIEDLIADGSGLINIKPVFFWKPLSSLPSLEILRKPEHTSFLKELKQFISSHESGRQDTGDIERQIREGF